MTIQFVSIGTPNTAEGANFLMAEISSEKLEFQITRFLGNIIISQKDFDMLVASLSKLGIIFQETNMEKP